MKILITGGSGMVGKNLLANADIAKHDLLAPSSSELNLLDFNSTLSLIEKEQPELVIHCAGKVGGIQANIDAPVSFLVDNIDMGKNLVLAAQQAKIPKLLNLASSCMYPKGISEGISEQKLMTGTLEPTNEGYALAKIVITKLCQYINQSNPQLQYKTLIPCNLYGPHDHFNTEKSHLIAAIISKVHQAKQEQLPSVEIWGDGKARREFLYAEDLADFIAYSIENFDRLPEQLNVGVGSDHSVNDYYLAAAAVMDYQGAFTHDLDRAVGMKRKLSDVSLLNEFGWQAKTELKDGINLTYQYFLKNL